MQNSVQEASELQQLIPHGPGMCMLDKVEYWDQQTISCTSTSHRRAENPLLENGVLNTVILIEYGAQAAAVHAGLIHSALGNAARPAFIGAVKDVQLYAQIVDPAQEVLTVNARVMLNDAGGAVYTFSVGDGERVIIRGRLSVIQQK